MRSGSGLIIRLHITKINQLFDVNLLPLSKRICMCTGTTSTCCIYPAVHKEIVLCGRKCNGFIPVSGEEGLDSRAYIQRETCFMGLELTITSS
jgi:hypothetical protein